jgi:predicted ATPase/class 3 adenylate cyclase
MISTPQQRGVTVTGVVPGHRVFERCWEDAWTVTFAGENVSSGAPVFVRMLKTNPPNAFDSEALRHDYEFAKSVEACGILKPLAYGAADGAEFLVVADDGTRPLHELLLERRLNLLTSLELAVRLTAILGELHHARVIHGNLNPHSIWFDTRSLETRLTDFSRASRADDLTLPADVKSYRRDFRYIAPEQTGRASGKIDPRTDLYGMGVVLYQLLCGAPPFDGDDPVGLIHAHLARVPVAPHVVNSEIPQPVSEIVMKQLSKSAEDRYQSARGLEYDLGACLKQLRSNTAISGVVVGARDVTTAFRVSNKLYGRDTETTALRAALDRTVRGSTELFLVSGAPGIGKSQLVRSVQAEARAKGAFIIAKFDQFNQNEPYSFMIRAFRGLIEQLLAGSDASIRVWRERLLEALEVNGKVIASVIPEIELIIGSQPNVQQLPAAEKLYRFNRVFRQFVRVFAREDHFLCIFVDDLQWADAASLALLKTLLTDRHTSNFLVIGAYRDTGVDVSSGSLPKMLDELRAVDVPITHIALSQLSVDQVGELLGDTFNCPRKDAAPLAELIVQKTDGNPLFVSQFLSFLHDERLIDFNYAKNQWEWDLRRISAQGVTEDVLALMSRKLLTIPPLAQEALKAAACMGSRFSLSELRSVMGEEGGRLLAALQAAEAVGLIIAAPNSGEPLQDGGAGATASGGGAMFQFLHDRVQQAAYALISPDARQELRLRIGRTLLAALPSDRRSDVPFVVVDNLNGGAGLITSIREREDVARLNLAVGRRAREQAAFAAALEYFRTGMQLLGPDAWTDQYDLALDLRLQRFECAYVSGHPEEANALFDEALANARTSTDKASAYYLKILLNSGLDRSDEAVALGIEALRLFGETLPPAPSKLQLFRELARVLVLLRGRRAHELAALPQLVDADRRTVISLLMSICPAAYFRNQDLMSLAALRIMRISLRHGNASASSFGYVLYGLIRGGLFADYKGGHEFGRLAVDLAIGDNNIAQRCKVMLIFAGFINFWREPVDTSIEMLRTSLKLALDSGDVQYANYSILQIIFLQLARGAGLDQAYAECTQHEHFVKHTNDWFAITSLEIRKQQILALKGETENDSSLSDAKYHEETHLAGFRAVGNLTALSYYLIVKMQLTYLSRQYDEALNLGEESESLIKSAINQIVMVEHYFYRGLTAAALIRSRGARRGPLWRTLKLCRKKLRRWARNCPQNYQAHYNLIEAESESLNGRIDQSERYYDDTIAVAQRHGWQHLEALAGELAGESYLRRNRRHVAKTYLQAARQSYAKWGAVAKSQQIASLYADVLGEVFEPAQRTAPDPARRNDLAHLIELDAVLRATTAISAEMESDRLLTKLMRLVLESVGGERALFITQQGEKLHVAAAGSTDGAQVRIFSGPSAEGSDHHFSERIVGYVLRTGRQLVLEDARADARFNSCPYVVACQPRSVLCTPLVTKGEIFGAIYVENRLVQGTFTLDRLQPLLPLLQQVAAIVENARLQHNLEENIADLQAAMKNVKLLELIRGHLTKFVPQSLQKLIDTNPENPDLQNHNEDVSILFLDIAGYTSMSEKLNSEQLSEIVETYFSSFLDDIHANGGDINDVAGDGLMIIFQHPDPTMHARLATRAALSIRERTFNMNRDARGDWPTVVVNVGIHSGQVLLGANKMESTGGTRWVYTATGYSTNLAARIGASATNGAILVSEATAARLGDEFELQGRGPQQFKGISRGIDVFSVIGEKQDKISGGADERDDKALDTGATLDRRQQ